MEQSGGFGSRIQQWLLAAEIPPVGVVPQPVDGGDRLAPRGHKSNRGSCSNAEGGHNRYSPSSCTLPPTLPDPHGVAGALPVGSGGTGIAFHADMAKHRRAPEPFALEECKTAAYFHSLVSSSLGGAEGGQSPPVHDFGADQSFGHPECERPERVERTWSHLVACGLPQLCRFQCGPRDAFEVLPLGGCGNSLEPIQCLCCCCIPSGSGGANSTRLCMRNTQGGSGPLTRGDAIAEPLVPIRTKLLRLVHDRDHIDAVDGYSNSIEMARLLSRPYTTSLSAAPSPSRDVIAGPPYPVTPLPKPFSVDAGNDLYFNNATARAARLAAQGVVQLALEVCKWDPVELRWFEQHRPTVLRTLRERLQAESSTGSSSSSTLLPQRAIQNGLAVVRPPGHHCSGTSPSGFCFYNNVAIAARAAQRAFPERIKRVLIVDWDVHHGNGTAEVFNDDPSVLFFSVHQHGSKAGHTVRMSRVVKAKLYKDEARREKWRAALQEAQREVSRRQAEAEEAAAAVAAAKPTPTRQPSATADVAEEAPDRPTIGSKRARNQEISAEELLAAFFAGTSGGSAAEPAAAPFSETAAVTNAEGTQLPDTQHSVALASEAKEDLSGRRGGRPRRRIDVVALDAQLEGSDLNHLLASAGVPTSSPPTPAPVATLSEEIAGDDESSVDDDDGSATTSSSAGSGLSWMKSVLREGGEYAGDSSSHSEDEEWSESSSANGLQVDHHLQAVLSRKLQRVRRKFQEAQGRTVRGDLKRRRRVARDEAVAGDVNEPGSSVRKRGFKVGSRSQFRAERLAFKGDATPDGSSFSDRVDVWTDGAYSLSEGTWCSSSDNSHNGSVSAHNGKGKSSVNDEVPHRRSSWRYNARSRLCRRKQAPFYPASGFLDHVGGTEAVSGRHRKRSNISRLLPAERAPDGAADSDIEASSEGRRKMSAGTTINAPWPTHKMSDLEYLYLLETILIPLTRATNNATDPFFRPDLIVVSSGFDSCAEDILGSQGLSPTAYYWMTHLLASIFTVPASDTTRPRPLRMVVALEGGYNLRNVALSSEMVLRALLETSDDRNCLEELEQRRGAAERSVVKEIKQLEAQRRQVRIETRRLRRLAKEVRACLKAGTPIPLSAIGTAAASGRRSAIDADDVFSKVEEEYAHRRRVDWGRAAARGAFCGSCLCCRQTLLVAKNRSLMGQCRQLAAKIKAAHAPFWGKHH